MSKDPAILFYTSDFITGTLTMTDDQKGKYITLLCLQHQQGYLTDEDMLNICKTYDKKIYSKFSKNGDGLYYNERMKKESERRQKYSQSRSQNRKICKTYDNHMETITETETITENKNRIKKTKNKKFIPPTIDEVKKYFKESGYSEDCAVNAFEYYTDLEWHDKNDNPVLNWKTKMRTVWFKDEYRLQVRTDFSPLNDIIKTLKK
jgi:hypothetical protein